MRALQVVLPPREPGGHERALFGWLADAAAAGWLQPTVHLPRGALERAALEAGLNPVQLVTADSGAVSTRAALAAVLAPVRTARRPPPLLLAPGVLHAQAWLTAAAVARRRSTWVYVPMAYRARPMGYRWAGMRDAALSPWLRAVQGWITIDAHQAALLRSAWGVQAPVHVLPNRVRLPAGPGPAWPAPDPQGCLRVGFVGRFDAAQKGLDWLCAALGRRPVELGRVLWHFQGQGPAQPLLDDLALRLGPDCVRVHPHAPIDDALARCDLLLLASRYEGLPLVALEATARGWPVVATHAARLGELLPASSLFEFGSMQGLAHALDSLREPAARQAAVRHAQARLASHLTSVGYREALRTVVDALPCRASAASAGSWA